MRTGDIGYFDNEGHLCIVDRLKELTKYKGFQIAPVYLEAILLDTQQSQMHRSSESRTMKQARSRRHSWFCEALPLRMRSLNTSKLG